MIPGERVPGEWINGRLPENVRLGTNTVIKGDLAFKRFHSRLRNALTIGSHCMMDGAHFDLGLKARMVIGDYCYFTNAVLLCELEVVIGNYVVIGWNTTVADSDFHPIAPAERIADAIACSPLGRGSARPEAIKLPVTLEDNVWVGPNATILKGVRIGSGSFIEAGSVVTRDVAPRSRMMGNPAQMIGTIS